MQPQVLKHWWLLQKVGNFIPFKEVLKSTAKINSIGDVIGVKKHTRRQTFQEGDQFKRADSLIFFFNEAQKLCRQEKLKRKKVSK